MKSCFHGCHCWFWYTLLLLWMCLNAGFKMVFFSHLNQRRFTDNSWCEAFFEDLFLLVFFYALFYAFFMTRPLLFLDPVQCASCGRGRTQNWPWILVWERILKIIWLTDWEVAESLLWPSKANTIGAQWKILKQEAYWETLWLVGSRDDSLRERIVKAQKLVNEVCCESPRAA